MIEGSVWRGILLSSRLRNTAAMRGRSVARAVSSSTIEARVTTCRTVSPRSAMPASSGPITSRKRCVMRRTSARGASGDCGTSYVSGKRYPSRSAATGSRSRTGAGSRAASRNVSRSIPSAITRAAISSRLRPSGMVRSRRTTSPRRSTSRMPSRDSGPERAYSPAFSWAPTPRARASARKTSGWRTRPSAWSCRAIVSAVAPGGTTSRTGGAPSAIFGQLVSCHHAPQAPPARTRSASRASPTRRGQRRRRERRGRTPGDRLTRGSSRRPGRPRRSARRGAPGG